uniref:CCHC-type domain-containing protein n=1 Tax=Amphiprion percula TaxID=161767 RepID=A0A3P8RK92_AMPPE
MNPENTQPGLESAWTPQQLHQAVSNQGGLLGQHDQMLKGLSDSNHNMLSQVNALTDKVTELSTLIAQRLPTPTPSIRSRPASGPGPAGTSQGPPVTHEPFVPTPEHYGGDQGSCQAFLMQTSLVFELQPLTYSTDRSRIAYILSLLTGAARDWGSAVWAAQTAVCHSYVAFVQEMRKVFDHPVRGRDAGGRLFSLRQASRSTAEYAVEFRTLAAESGWNDVALQGAFQRGLSEAVKDELATRDESSSLDELIALAIRLDNRIRERRRERGARFLQLTQPRPSYCAPSPSRNPPPRILPVASAPPPAASAPEDEPMQLGRAHLSEEEKQRRRQTNACLYCGEMGHYAAACPSKRGKGLARQ